MDRVFSSVLDYVKYISALPIGAGEYFCYSFLPSAFFPKHIIDDYFGNIEALPHHKEIADLLWGCRRRSLRAFREGTLSVVIEHWALQRFIVDGIVHEARPEFQVSFAVRVQVLEEILRSPSCANVIVTREFLPYGYRLHTPDTVVLDVQRNVSSQSIQGLLITDTNVFDAFLAETIRLSRAAVTGQDAVRLIEDAIERLGKGQPQPEGPGYGSQARQP
jgi:hypothetical protein